MREYRKVVTLNEKEKELYKIPSFILADLEDDDVNDEYKDNYLVETENGKACGFLNVSSPEIEKYRILGFHNEIGDNTVQLAYEIAKRAHYGVKDKAGNEPYFNHLKRFYRTALTFGDEKGLGEVALLHDVVEDTPYTLESLHSEFAKIGKGTYYDLYIRDSLDAVSLLSIRKMRNGALCTFTISRIWKHAIICCRKLKK